MSKPHFKQKTIANVHESLNLENPQHPLITVIDTAKLVHSEEDIGTRFSSDLYCIALKDSNCGLDYGRTHLDFTKGSLLFSAPQQVFTVTKAQELGEVEGWLLYFHPDLIRNTSLADKMDSYNFFNYEIHEALHVSDKEEEIFNNCVDMIRNEISERIDNHSQQVLVSNIELMLNYAIRFYERQFLTRASQNHDVVAKVERLLQQYYQQDKLTEIGQPSIQYLADQCHLSPSYLSDLLAKETGRSAKTHINDFLLDKAKNLLLSSEDSVSGIAYLLGFNYPHYFGRLFKKKTGLTPNEYRQAHS